MLYFLPQNFFYFKLYWSVTEPRTELSYLVCFIILITYSEDTIILKHEYYMFYLNIRP